MTLAGQTLPPEVADDIITNGTIVTLALPVVASDGSHSTILLAYFSEAQKPLLSSHMTSVHAVNHIKSIEVGDGFVTLTHGCDVMNISVDHEKGCLADADVAEDFDLVSGKDVRLSNFPARFDWGCDMLGCDVAFCERLEPFMEAIDDANGDVCTTMSTSKSKRCSASMRITEMTGVFREAMPYLADMVPVQSVESQYINRDHLVGLVFPCF